MFYNMIFFFKERQGLASLPKLVPDLELRASPWLRALSKWAAASPIPNFAILKNKQTKKTFKSLSDLKKREFKLP